MVLTKHDSHIKDSRPVKFISGKLVKTVKGQF